MENVKTIPLVSIITVCYNVVDSIEKTILSVINKKNSDLEYIVIDGGSTDGTVALLNRYKGNIETFVSEPDKGIYDAMNKGIQLAKGKYVCFINSGDLLLELPFEKIRNKKSDLIAFPVKLSNDKNFIPQVNFSLKIRNTLPHQGCFYENNSRLKFDIDFKVFSDFCLNQKIYKNSGNITVFDSPIVAYHDMGGISHNRKYGNEIFRVVKQNYGIHYLVLSWLYFKKQGLVKRLKNLIE